MARIKTQEEAPVIGANENEEENPVVGANENDAVSASAEETKTPIKAVKESVAPSEEYTDMASNICKLFKDKAVLYISASGGVFDEDTEPSVRGNAILYKNPYYKS